MHALISRDQERAIARRAISPSDMYKWPGLTFDAAGTLQTGRIFIGPTEADSRPFKLKHLVFMGSSRDMRCWGFAVSPDGKLLAVSFWSTILVWRLSDGLLVQRLQDHAHTNEINSLAFAPNNHHLVSGADDNTEVVWDVRSGRPLLRLKEHEKRVWTVAYSPDGSHIATGSDDNSVKIWDASSGVCMHSLALDEIVDKVIFSPDGSRIAVQLKHKAAICDVQPGAQIATLQHEGCRNMYLSLSSHGDRIVTATSDGQAKVWSTITGEELLKLDHRSLGVASVAFSPDGTEVATAAADGTAAVCDSWKGQQRRVYQMPTAMSSVAYSPKGNYIAMGDDSGRVRVCNVRSGAFVVDLEGHTEAISDLQFLPDGNHL